MPRNRDMHLYHALQAKLTQQEVDYQNMHTHSTIVRGDHGKVTKIDGDQYHPDMQLQQFEPNGAQLAHYAAGDFKPEGSERPSSAATPATFVAQGTISVGQRPSRDAVMRDGRSLMTLPSLPEANQDEQVWFSEEREGTRANLRRQAPNQNPSVDLIDMKVEFGDEDEEKKSKYVSHVAKRVSQRRKLERHIAKQGFADDRIAAVKRHGAKTKEDYGEARREKGSKEKKSQRQLRFEKRRQKSNETVIRERKRKQNPMTKRRPTMDY